MSKKFISQVELAEANGVSKQAINQLVKKGIFAKCFEGKRLVRDCALKTYLENKDPSRDNQREANQKDKISPAKKSVVKKNLTTEKVIPEIEKATSKNIKDSDLYNQDNLDELKDLLLTASTGNQKVQIIKDFWTGKINQQKYLEGEKLLIPKEQIIKDVQRILKAFRDKALALPTKISSDLVGLTEKKDVAVVVESYMYELLEELSNLEDVE
ncbi:hypothetical protein [Sulfurimonas sp.]|uniref:hypothetical protein n=1 Tax=Sulfurimonas sp. TaxID=2022749 RepID=UPI0025CE9294|nr:hypothetical protein [Sulfurimonas sp.]